MARGALILAWLLLVAARASGDDGGGVVTRDWVLGGALGVLQLVALGWLRDVRTKLDRHDERLSAHNERLGVVERVCAERHGRRRDDS